MATYGANTNIDNERKYLNDLISKGGGSGEWAKSQMKELDAFASQQQSQPKQQTQPTTPIAAEAIYYTPTGEKQFGYNIGGKTYKDQSGTQRIDKGSYTNAGGAWWQMGDTGGTKVDIPDFAKTLDNMGSYENMLGGMVFPTFNSQNSKEIQGQLGSVLEALQNFQPTDSMSKDESQARAYAQLNNLYNANLDKALDNYNKDAINRGMFGQLPVEELKQNAISESELSKASAISDLAGDMYSQDFNMARQQDQDFYNRQNMMLNVLAQTYGIESDMYQNALNEFTTMSDLATNENAMSFEKALNKLNTLGYADQEIADILGVPVGTPSEQINLMEIKDKMAKENFLWEIANTPVKASGGSGGGGGSGVPQEVIDSYPDITFPQKISLWNEAIEKARTGKPSTTDMFGNVIEYQPTEEEVYAEYLKLAKIFRSNPFQLQEDDEFLKSILGEMDERAKSEDSYKKKLTTKEKRLSQ